MKAFEFFNTAMAAAIEAAQATEGATGIVWSDGAKLAPGDEIAGAYVVYDELREPRPPGETVARFTAHAATFYPDGRIAEVIG